MFSIRSKHGKAGLALLCGVVLSIAGCRTLEQIAPPVDEQLVMASAASAPALMRGRSIYLTQCASCHVALPVTDYDAKQWETILVEMNPEARLKPAQAHDLKRYIEACLADAPRRAQQPASGN